MPRMTRRTGARAALLALSALAASWMGAGAAAATPAVEYVALGDSFAAGPLILPQEALDPCFRSTNDYAHVLARTIGATTFRDVTCSSATTANILSTPQKAVLPVDPSVPLQIGAVTPTTTLVTISTGANDADLAGLALGCLTSLPLGPSCQARNTVNGADQGAAAIDGVAPDIAATIDAVHAKAPHARIVLTSYGNYVKPGGCYPLQPMLPADADYVQGLVNRLGQVTKAVAAAHHAEYVDLIGPGAGHDGCNPTQGWVPLIGPGTPLGVVPLHPTALGEQNFARIIAAHLAGTTSGATA